MAARTSFIYIRYLSSKVNTSLKTTHSSTATSKEKKTMTLHHIGSSAWEGWGQGPTLLSSVANGHLQVGACIGQTSGLDELGLTDLVAFESPDSLLDEKGILEALDESGLLSYCSPEGSTDDEAELSALLEDDLSPPGSQEMDHHQSPTGPPDLWGLTDGLLTGFCLNPHNLATSQHEVGQTTQTLSTVAPLQSIIEGGPNNTDMGSPTIAMSILESIQSNTGEVWSHSEGNSAEADLFSGMMQSLTEYQQASHSRDDEQSCIQVPITHLTPPPTPPEPARRQCRLYRRLPNNGDDRKAVLCDRKNRKMGQNKEAALRYREKKKAKGLDQLSELTKEENRNTELKNKIEELEKEMVYLKGLLGDILKAKGVIKSKEQLVIRKQGHK